MLIQSTLELYLVIRGLTAERAHRAAEVVAPLIEGYLDAAKTCPPAPPPPHGRRRKAPTKRRSPYSDIDAEFAVAAATPAVTEAIDVPADGIAFAAVAALGVRRPRRFLLAGDDASLVIEHFQNLAAQKFISTVGLKEYLYDPRGGLFGDHWLVSFLKAVTGGPLCNACRHRWLDGFAEDYVRFLACENDAMADALEPYLRHLAPYVRCDGFTRDGDLLVSVR